MLVLSRKVNEEIIIGDNIKVTVVRLAGNRIRLGITAPDDVVIRRAEVAFDSEPHDESRELIATC
ncbi:MAG: carbon storage regulator [Planctomycetia bacterium]|nr:carbon storage regulator [Planctomycetia bacterium]